jgi:hypothetical protein
MSDLIIPAGTTRVVNSSAPLEAQYDLFRMEANSTLVAEMDLVIKAVRAEFQTGCVINASGQTGQPGADGTGFTLHQGGVFTGKPGDNGANGENAHSITIEAGLAKVGELKLTANGGSGGSGGSGAAVPSGQPGAVLLEGGRGGNGGQGGDAGQITVRWKASSSSIPADIIGPPVGHDYRSDGGTGGPGGAGGAAGIGEQGAGLPGAPGAPGESGAGRTPLVEWRPRTRTTIWVQKQDIGPSARTDHAMAWDVARKRLVLFGGGPSDSVLGDTWEWNGALWVQVQDIGPSARCMHGMALDPVNEKTLLFGGSSTRAAEHAPLLGDTWLWDGEDWVQIADTGPSARRRFAIATDPDRKRVVLFGGENADGTFARDTWEWDGSEWMVREDTGPKARRGAQMAYDAWSETIVLFGGDDGSQPGDTWAWNGEHWTQIADTGPGGRAGHAMSTDGVGVILFGGRRSANAPDAGDEVLTPETWAFYEDSWREIHDMGPSARAGHTLAFDADAQRVILFGGQDLTSPTLRGDTWYLIDRPKK